MGVINTDSHLFCQLFHEKPPSSTAEWTTIPKMCQPCDRKTPDVRRDLALPGEWTSASNAGLLPNMKMKFKLL